MSRALHPVYRNAAFAYRRFSVGFFARQDRALRAALAETAQLAQSRLRRLAHDISLKIRRIF